MAMQKQSSTSSQAESSSQAHLKHWNTHHDHAQGYPYVWRHTFTGQWVAINNRNVYAADDSYDGYVVEAWDAEWKKYTELGSYTRKDTARKRAVSVVRENPEGWVWRDPEVYRVAADYDKQFIGLTVGGRIQIDTMAPPSDDDLNLHTHVPEDELEPLG